MSTAIDVGLMGPMAQTAPHIGPLTAARSFLATPFATPWSLCVRIPWAIRAGTRRGCASGRPFARDPARVLMTVPSSLCLAARD